MRHETISAAFIHPQQATVLHLETHDNVHVFTRARFSVGLQTSHNSPPLSTLRHETMSTAFIHPQQATVLHLETHGTMSTLSHVVNARFSAGLQTSHNSPPLSTLRHGTTSTLSHVVNAQLSVGLQTPLAVEVHHGAARVPNGPAFGLQPSAVHEPQPAQGTP